MKYTQIQLLHKFICNNIKSGTTDEKSLQLKDSRLFFLNKCIAVRSINNNNNHEELIINLHRYDKKTEIIQQYLLNNSFQYNRTIILFDNDKEFECYCYQNFNIGHIQKNKLLEKKKEVKVWT